LVEAFPTADFIYLADQANTPYGGRQGEEIVALTRSAAERLFLEGASLVVLACNTAAAIALRRLQQTWLPGVRQRLGRPVNLLGLIVPTIEAATGLPWEHEAERRGEKVEKLDVVGVFSTPATARSRVYEIEIDKRRQDVAVFCPELARMIEEGAEAGELAEVIGGHVASLSERIGRPPGRAILGCTHYELAADLFRRELPEGTPIIHQPEATAASLARYLERHPEYPPGSEGRRVFLTTREDRAQTRLIEAFWGGPLVFEKA
jgi:glutamate racemase